MNTFVPAAFWSPGPLELVVIGIVALLLFGPRLPSVMRSLGKGIVEFKKGLRDTEDQINREIDKSDDTSSNKRIDPPSGD